jgi:hypothetical protein
VELPQIAKGVQYILTNGRAMNKVLDTSEGTTIRHIVTRHIDFSNEHDMRLPLFCPTPGNLGSDFTIYRILLVFSRPLTSDKGVLLLSLSVTTHNNESKTTIVLCIIFSKISFLKNYMFRPSLSWVIFRSYVFLFKDNCTINIMYQ